MPLALLLLSGCAPKLTAAGGAVYTGPVPNTRIEERKLVRFRWEYAGHATAGKGRGVVRIAPPDSARLDMIFAEGALGGAGPHAILLGNGPICFGQAEGLRDMLPEPSFVWAALGRLSVPPAGDTAKRMRDGKLIVDIGSDPVWRAVFEGSRFESLQRAAGIGSAVQERVTRGAGGTVTYVKGENTLRLSELREENAEPFAPEIFRC